jgi:ammonium transporter Rh
MGVLEVVFYSVNEAVLFRQFFAADVGGAVFIHLFGAVFGLVVAAIARVDPDAADTPLGEMASDKASDTLAMVGTLFLFCYWPSYNGALAGELIQDRTVVNTYLSLMACAVTTFLVSCLVDDAGRFSMLDVQNAVIAGGVAIGGSADMKPHPFGAMLIGIVAGAATTIGMRRVAPWLTKATGVTDTCNVLSVYVAPGLIGGIAGIVLASYAEYEEYGSTLITVFPKRAVRSARSQAEFQAAALFTTVGIAVVGGGLTGAVCRWLPMLARFYDDSVEYAAAPAGDTQGCGGGPAQAANGAAGQNVVDGDMRVREPIGS